MPLRSDSFTFGFVYTPGFHACSACYAMKRSPGQKVQIQIKVSHCLAIAHKEFKFHNFTQINLMSRIIIELKDDGQFDSLEEYLKKQGIVFKTEEEYQLDKQKQLMKIFEQLVLQSPKTDISQKEIDEIVEEVRTRRYEKNNS